MQKIVSKEYIFKIITKIILVIFFIVGLIIYKDYGFSWDEMFQRSGGVVNLKFIYEFLDISKFLSIFFDNVPTPPESIVSLNDWKEQKHLQRFYGVAFDVPAVILEYLFFGNSNDELSIYHFRHLLTFLVFFFGVCALKNQVARLFSSQFFAFISVILILLSPRMFAEGFYNCKDIVFMSLISLGMLMLTKISYKPSIKNILLFSLITALAINVRVLGILFFPLTAFVLIFLSYCNKIQIIKTVKLYSIYIMTSSFLTILFFPYLWDNPILNFIEAFKAMSSFPVESDSTLLYLGKLINLRNLPWHYLPIWILITTPPLIIILFFFGVINILNLKKKLIVNYDHKDIILIANFAIVIAPILAIIVFNSVIYNGWRHVYFIYPAFIIISLYGFKYIFEKVRLFRHGFISLIIIFVIFIFHQIYWIVKAHPLQNVYFNFIAGKDWKDKFDLDYWGLGNHIVLKNILFNDKRELIYICAKSYMSLSTRYLNNIDKNRVKISCFGEPDYILNNYYRPLRTDIVLDSTYKTTHQLKIFDEIIISVYKKIK